MSRCLVLVFLSGVLVAAAEQPRLGAAVKVGVNYDGWYQEVIGRESARDHSNAWTLGPAIELRVADRIAIEAGAFYRQIGRDAGGGYSFSPFSARERGYAWEFPVIAKYRLPFRLRGLRPFAGAGPAFEWQRTHTDSIATSFTTNPQGQPVFIQVASKSAASDANFGLTAGLGLEPKAGPVRLIIESRYTRWTKDTTCSQGQSFLRCVEPNQGVFLVGIGF